MRKIISLFLFCFLFDSSLTAASDPPYSITIRQDTANNLTATITARTDSLTINKVSANRGNCTTQSAESYVKAFIASLDEMNPGQTQEMAESLETCIQGMSVQGMDEQTCYNEGANTFDEMTKALTAMAKMEQHANDPMAKKGLEIFAKVAQEADISTVLPKTLKFGETMDVRLGVCNLIEIEMETNHGTWTSSFNE